MRVTYPATRPAAVGHSGLPSRGDGVARRKRRYGSLLRLLPSATFSPWKKDAYDDARGTASVHPLTRFTRTLVRLVPAGENAGCDPPFPPRGRGETVVTTSGALSIGTELVTGRRSSNGRHDDS